VLWQAGTASTAASFAGGIGHIYAFYSVATDYVGHIEVAPDEPDASTTASATEASFVYLPLVLKSHTSGPQEVIILEETFEGAFPGQWNIFDDQAGEGEYHWARRNCRAFQGAHSGWAVGGGADGATLACDDDYPDDADSWMIYGPFSLADATQADMTFQLWLNSELTYDRIWWWASTDGHYFYGNWWSGNTEGWVEKTLDLTDVYTLGDLTGEPEVWVALTFSSDGSLNYPEGAYVDDIVVRKSVTGASALGGGQRRSGADSGLWTLPNLLGQAVLETGGGRVGAALRSP